MYLKYSPHEYFNLQKHIIGIIKIVPWKLSYHIVYIYILYIVKIKKVLHERKHV